MKAFIGKRVLKEELTDIEITTFLGLHDFRNIEALKLNLDKSVVLLVLAVFRTCQHVYWRKVF